VSYISGASVGGSVVLTIAGRQAGRPAARPPARLTRAVYGADFIAVGAILMATTAPRCRIRVAADGADERTRKHVLGQRPAGLALRATTH